MQIDDLRLEIDSIDDELTKLFVERMNISLKIAEYKKENSLPVLNAQREDDILRRISEKVGPGLAPYAREFFGGLFAASRSYQSSFLLKYGLAGENLSYSYSQTIHEMLGDYKYQLFSLTAKEFEALILSRDFDGLNITIPYKITVIPYCDEISETANEIGSVNTVYKKDGRLLGANTDYAGFLYMLKRSGITLKGKKVLILGAGGASLTIQKCARDEGASQISVARRTHDFSKDFDSEIIINATPVGTYPDNGAKLIDLADFPKCCGALDVVYNPLRTDLLLRAKERALPHSGGLPMLVAQATAAAGLFTGKDYTYRNEEILSRLTASIQNIVLVGMPGAGKSVVGFKLAKTLNKDFVDMDTVISEKAGMSIPDIFKKYGETRFRDMETDVAREYGKLRNLVISTGGGCVLRGENMDCLTQNAVVVFLDRPLESLATNGRPLSKDTETLKKMYTERLPLYEKHSDHRVDCGKSVDEIVSEIAAVFMV